MVTEPMTEAQKQVCITMFHTVGITTNFAYYDGLRVTDGFIDKKELMNAISNKDSSLSSPMILAIRDNILANFDTDKDDRISLQEMEDYAKNINTNKQVGQQVINQFIQAVNEIKETSNNIAVGTKEEFLNLIPQAKEISERDVAVTHGLTGEKVMTKLMFCLYLPYQCQDGSWLVVYRSNNVGSDFGSIEFFSPHGREKAEKQVQEFICDCSGSNIEGTTNAANLIGNGDMEGSRIYLPLIADVFRLFSGLNGKKIVTKNGVAIRPGTISWEEVRSLQVSDFQIYRQQQSISANILNQPR